MRPRIGPNVTLATDTFSSSIAPNVRDQSECNASREARVTRIRAHIRTILKKLPRPKSASDDDIPLASPTPFFGRNIS